MQVQNLQIYNNSTAVGGNGPWIDVSNLVSLSVQINNFAAGTGTGGADIEVSNDPNVMIDGAVIGPPSAAPVLSQFLSTPGNLSTPPGNIDTSMLPAQTFFVKTTFITKWGETTASPESSLAVLQGNYLYVAAPVPSATQAPFVTGFNVYVSLATTTECLQTGPPYSPQRLIDGTGTVGGTVATLGPNQSTHFALTGAIPISYPGWAMVNGFQQTQWLASALTDQSGGTNSGVSVTQLAGFAGSVDTSVAVWISSSNVMWTPSCMTWKYLRVAKGAATVVAYLNGQRG